VRLQAAYEDAERQVFLTTRDLSERGAYLVVADPPPPGRTAQVVLELPDEGSMLRIRGVVVRRSEEMPSGFALRFEREAMPQGTRQALQSLVKRAGSSAE
jgi:hypothetical protein